MQAFRARTKRPIVYVRLSQLTFLPCAASPNLRVRFAEHSSNNVEIAAVKVRRFPSHSPDARDLRLPLYLILYLIRAASL
jgi:hypothetical protein